MSKLVLTEKMQALLTFGSKEDTGILLYKLFKYHKDGFLPFTLDELGTANFKVWSLLKAEYDKNKQHAEIARKSRQKAVEQVTVTSQLCQEKETPNEKESPSPAPLPKEKENTKEKELFVQNEFGRWWKEFPKKEAKKKAFEIFRGKCKKLNEAGIKELVDLMLAETKAQGIEKGWNYKTRRQYIPMPTTWLNQERYMDGVSKREIIPFAHPDNRGAAKRPANYLPSEGGTDGAF